MKRQNASESARAYNSTNKENWPAIRSAVVQNDEVDALLISPERLADEKFVKELLNSIAEKIGLLVVDEAHCISDWGHDFRPDYRRLVNILQSMPANVPILGTTATANNRVVADVQTQLRDIDVQRGSLMRSSLALQIIQSLTEAKRLAWLAEHVTSLPGTGIIYTLTVRDAKQVSNWLQSRKIESQAYFGDLSDALRQHLEQQLLDNKIKVLVATTALGMGYDKPDLGFVVHYQSPGSIVDYYQQVGRAGRSINHAVGILMAGEKDEQIHEHFRKSAFPKEEWVREILAALEESSGLKVSQLEKAVNLKQGQIKYILKYLSVENPAPVSKSGSLWSRTINTYNMNHDKIKRLTGQRETEWDEVRRYVADEGCLMEFLARALDDKDPQPCGKCAHCLGQPIVPPTFSRETEISATQYLSQAELELEPRKLKIPEHLRPRTGRILSRWKDDCWGQLVAVDKQAGHFRDELVHAVVEMLEERWQPKPEPEWVTCIPSLKNPELVPDFARRLADALGLPFKAVVKKVKRNEEQKKQQNQYHQRRNLDGVFGIKGSVPTGPVLLVDDVVDSRWTLTIVARLLLEAGSGHVLPCVLTTSSLGA